MAGEAAASAQRPAADQRQRRQGAPHRRRGARRLAVPHRRRRGAAGRPDRAGRAAARGRRWSGHRRSRRSAARSGPAARSPTSSGCSSPTSWRCCTSWAWSTSRATATTSTATSRASPGCARRSTGGSPCTPCTTSTSSRCRRRPRAAWRGCCTTSPGRARSSCASGPTSWPPARKVSFRPAREPTAVALRALLEADLPERKLRDYLMRIFERTTEDDFDDAARPRRPRGGRPDRRHGTAREPLPPTGTPRSGRCWRRRPENKWPFHTGRTARGMVAMLGVAADRLAAEPAHPALAERAPGDLDAARGAAAGPGQGRRSTRARQGGRSPGPTRTTSPSSRSPARQRSAGLVGPDRARDASRAPARRCRGRRRAAGRGTAGRCRPRPGRAAAGRRTPGSRPPPGALVGDRARAAARARARAHQRAELHQRDRPGGRRGLVVGQQGRGEVALGAGDRRRRQLLRRHHPGQHPADVGVEHDVPAAEARTSRSPPRCSRRRRAARSRSS